MMHDVPNGATLCDAASYQVKLSGEIDLLNASKVKDVLLEAVNTGQQGTVVVHASAVTFMDSTGLSALIVAVNHAKTLSRQIVIAEPRKDCDD